MLLYNNDTIFIIHYVGSEYLGNILSKYNLIFAKYLFGIFTKIVSSTIGWILELLENIHRLSNVLMNELHRRIFR